MTVSYSIARAPLKEPLLIEVTGLMQKIFGSYGEQEGSWRFVHMPDATLCQARLNAQLIGFKAGYAHTRSRYYSWLGAVLPEYRRQGIAAQLMASQHSWLRKNGYMSIETSAREKNEAMRRLNKSSGFREVGKRQKGDETDIIYEKHLSRQE